MRQPEATIANILKHSGQLFNTQGYKATSISDITKATKLTKGAIYRHFKDKDELESKALLHLTDIMFTTLKDKIKKQSTAPKKLKAVFGFFESYSSNPPIKGGCPLLNVSTEVDDTAPILRKQALAILDLLHDSILILLNNGIRHGQIKRSIKPEYHASIIIGSLEGAIMMSKLRGNDHDMKIAVRHLNEMLYEITV